MNVSLIMATVNRTDDIRRMVHSLTDQTDRAFELIIVDQNADDRLVPIVAEARALGLDVRHEKLSVRNLSAARNRGIEVARYDILGFPDDDCWYEGEVVERVRRLMQDQAYDAVIGRWHEEDPAGKPEHDLGIDEWRRFRGATASSITIFLSRRRLAALGGFDHRFGVSCWYGCGEETDLMFRILGNGAKVRYSPEVVVHHQFFSKPQGEISQVCRNVRHRSRGIGGLWAKHGVAPGVVLRGIVAPLVKPWLPPSSLTDIVSGPFVALGRVEGYMKWRREEGA